jgi:ribose 5-phosphate isomerase B
VDGALAATQDELVVCGTSLIEWKVYDGFEPETQMKMIIGSDHGGFELKRALVKNLEAWGVELEDLGCHDTNSVDYPDFAHQVASAVIEGRATFGLLICGTGQGMAMSANRHPGVRAALCTDTFTAQMARAHNDANLLCLGGRVVGPGLAESILRAFIDTPFEGGRHQRRVDAIELEP